MVACVRKKGVGSSDVYDNIQSRDSRIQLSIAEMLLRAGADVNAKSSTGVTALMEAAWETREQQTEIVKILIDAGAEVNIGRYTALKVAGYEGHPEITKILIDAGARE